MGMQNPKPFMPPQGLQQTGLPNDIVQQSRPIPFAPLNPIAPIIPDFVPFAQSPNSVPSANTTANRLSGGPRGRGGMSIGPYGRIQSM